MNDGAEVILLDAGMQQRHLFVDYQIMVLDKEYMFGNRLFFPSGPIKLNLFQAFCRTFETIYTSFSELMITSKHNKESYILLTAIAEPDKFTNSCKKENIKISKYHIFPNHHIYQNKELENIYKDNEKIITTEKDYVKIPKKYHKMTELLKIELSLKKILKSDYFLN